MVTYLGIESKVNIKKEQEAIVEFIDKYWEVEIIPKVNNNPVYKIKADKELDNCINNNISSIVDYILNQGIKFGIAYQEKIISPQIDFYNKIIGELGSNKKIDFQITQTEKNFDFSKKTKSIKNHLTKNYSINAEPKDYFEFKKSYKTLMTTPYKKCEFHGAELASSILLVCSDFADTLSTRGVYFDEKEENRKPLTNLIGAILRQGISIGYDLVEQKFGNKVLLKIEDITNR
jgi:ribulose bisphosphate carboxylase small subunit